MTPALARAPFLPFDSFTVEETSDTSTAIRSGPSSSRSPFISVYESSEGESPYDDPAREAYAALVNELHDEEFDEALFELQCHARALHDEHLCAGTSREEADRMLVQHFAPLIRESENLVDSMSRQFGPRESAGIVDHEVESFLDEYTPGASLDPEFENFFGKLLKKIGGAVKSAAGAAWQGIKKIGLGPILNRLKALIKPLLNRVLQKAIGYLPAVVQPAAQKLAEKLGFAMPKPVAPPAPPVANPSSATADAGSPVQDAAGSETAGPQQEFNEQIASAFLAQDEAELEMEVAQAVSASACAASPVFAELDDAREQFITELNDLKQGESAEPYVQNFLPAVLPALRLGIRLIGRPRVIGFLSPLLSKLIANLIGPEQAPALSNAIVDAGLKLLSLEMSESEQAGLAASAVASTVEETINRVASLPDYVLDNPELLEGFALEAFEQAAAANLPAVFSESTYRKRPELLEAGLNAAWLMLPLRGRKRYKRCSRVFTVRISPHMANEVEGFEGAPLSEYLQDQLGVPEGAEVEAQVHLYETLPGTTVADIARGERETLGPGMADEVNASQLHPLTPRAAAVLLGKPGLGRDLSGLSQGSNLAAGQRLFHLAIPGKRPLLTQGHHHGHHHRPHRRRPLHVSIHLDSQQDQIRACVFLSEVTAQKIAVRLRQSTNLGLLATGFRRSLDARLRRIFFGDAKRRLHLVHAGLRPGQTAGAALQNLPQATIQAFASQLQGWLVQGFAEFLKTKGPRFIAATEDAADGVSLRFTIEHPPGLKELTQAMVERGTGAAAHVAATTQQATVRVDVFAGHRCA